MAVRVSICLITVLLIVGVLRAGNDAERAAVIAERNRKAIESITSLKCRYSRTLIEGEKGALYRELHGTYVQQNGDYCYSEVDDVNQDARTIRTCAGRGEQMELWMCIRPHMPRKPGLTISRRDQEYRGLVWELLLFSHWGDPALSYVPLWEMLQKPHRIGVIHQPVDERNVTTLKLSHATGALEFHLDPAANYLVRKRVMIPSGGQNYRWEDEVTHFAEPARGVFVPTVVSHRVFVNGELKGVAKTELTGLVVNKTLPPADLMIPGIFGMTCNDTLRMCTYKVDPEGNQAGPHTPSLRENLVPVPEDIHQTSSSHVTDSTAPITSQPVDWQFWVVVGLFATGMAFWQLRRYMRDRLTELAKE